MTSAALRNHPATPPDRCGRRGVGALARLPSAAPCPLLPLSSVRPPLHASLFPRRRARSVRVAAAHRSSGLYDQAHADRRHPRGRNPRGGAGR
jgi:hypothetical protein